MSSDITARVKTLRARFDHPVIDGDGHLIEPAPLFQHYLAKIGGKYLVDRYQHELREHPTGSRGNRETGDMRGAWWGVGNDAYEQVDYTILVSAHCQWSGPSNVVNPPPNR